MLYAEPSHERFCGQFSEAGDSKIDNDCGDDDDVVCSSEGERERHHIGNVVENEGVERDWQFSSSPNARHYRPGRSNNT